MNCCSRQLYLPVATHRSLSGNERPLSPTNKKGPIVDVDDVWYSSTSTGSSSLESRQQQPSCSSHNYIRASVKNQKRKASLGFHNFSISSVEHHRSEKSFQSSLLRYTYGQKFKIGHFPVYLGNMGTFKSELQIGKVL